jgi:hypothetical protein|tara:strand:- start:119 stop:373 length:255 start_codon:yes stop_codon:yes gene_type:complete
MNKKEVDNHRVIVQSRLEELTILTASQGSDIKHMMAAIDRIEHLEKEQNGRVRKMEGDVSAFKAIGATVSVFFSSLFAYIFTRS